MTDSTTPVLPLVIGPLISPGFKLKATAAPPGHGADVRNLSVGQHKVTGLHDGAGFFGCLFQIMLGLGAIGQLLRFLR